MHVVINSDVIYSRDLRRTGLPEHVVVFLRRCAASGHQVIVPETTQIEFDSAQLKAYTNRVSEVEKAADILRHAGVEIQEFDATELIAQVPLLELLSRIEGLEFSLCPATIEDYQIALTKACLKSSPHPPDGKADEMRDLVIWQTALRVAEANGGAILLSRDEVHTHHRGDIEADAHGLRRTGDFDRALEMLDLESEASTLVRSLLSAKWADIVASELPMQQGATLLMARDPIFSMGTDGLTTATAEVTFSSGDGNELRCSAEITYISDPPRVSEIHLRQQGDGAAFDRVYEVGAGDQNDYQDRFEALQDIIGD